MTSLTVDRVESQELVVAGGLEDCGVKFDLGLNSLALFLTGTPLLPTVLASTSMKYSLSMLV